MRAAMRQENMRDCPCKVHSQTGGLGVVGVAWAREVPTGLRGATTRCGSVCGVSSEAAASGRDAWIRGGEGGQEDMWDFLWWVKVEQGGDKRSRN